MLKPIKPKTDLEQLLQTMTESTEETLRGGRTTMGRIIIIRATGGGGEDIL